MPTTRTTQHVIPSHLVTHRDAYCALVQKYFTPLGPKAVNQMTRAVSQPTNRFWSEVLWPQLWMDPTGETCDLPLGGISTPLNQRPIYVPLANTKKTPGHNHEIAEEAAQSLPASVQNEVFLFSNPLRVGLKHSEHEWEAPKERVVLAPFTVFTIEYDPPSGWPKEERVAFLDHQLGWFRKGGNNDLDRPIRPLWDWATQYSDFRGMSAAWSGHKSVHIHLLFDTSEVAKTCEGSRDHFRALYKVLWCEIAQAVEREFPQKVKPDMGLQCPDLYRRLPNGRVRVEKPDHILGIPVRTYVPQICLWEKLVARAPAGASKAFVDEIRVRQAAASSKPKRIGIRRRGSVGDMNREEHAYCSDRFNALIAQLVGGNGYPRGAGLFKESCWVGRLFANEFDRNPSTIIFEESNSVFVQGGKRPDRDVRLPFPLRFHIRRWRQEYARLVGRPVKPKLDEPTEDKSRPEEREFAEAATSISEARAAFERLLKKALDEHDGVLIQGPEGLGKTTAAAGQLPALISRLRDEALVGLPIENWVRRDVEWRRPSAFAFASYKLAAEKAQEFNTSAAATHLRAVVFPSFSRLYEESRDAIGETVLITAELAAVRGHSSVAGAIKAEQAEVWDEMRTRHARLYKSGPADWHKGIVFFVVHQVVQQFATPNLINGAFLHRDFFNTEARDWWKLKEEMRFRVVVHDEVPVEALVQMHPAGKVNWCRALFALAPDVWHADGTLKEQFRTMRAKLRTEPIQIDFDEVLEIFRAGYEDPDRTSVAECESYQKEGLQFAFADGRSIYAITHGREWYAKKRYWWHDLADRILLLTTEALPTAMVRSLNPQEGGFDVISLRAPGLVSGTIDVHLRKSCPSEQATGIVQEIRDHLGGPDFTVITNGANGLPDTVSHAGVRGSNLLAGQDVAQIVFFKPPAEYEQLQVVNRLFGLTAAIRLRHIDEINQTAGRNLGFRHDGRAEHHLVMGFALYEVLEDALASECRYGLRLVEGAQQRKRKRRGERQKVQHAAVADDADMRDIIAEHSPTA